MTKHSFLELPDESVAEIVSLFDGSSPRRVLSDSKNQAFWSACETVARAQGVNLADANPPSEQRSTEALLEHLADAASLRYRPVVLGQGWWRSDPGPLLVFERADKRPAAVIPDKSGRYRLVRFSAGERDTVDHLDEKTAARLDSGAYALYRPLPAKAIVWKDLLRFGFQGLGGDIRRLLYAVAAANVLGLAVPVSIGFIFDHVIPNSNLSLLGQFALALAVVSICGSIFFLAERIATTRLELKMTASLQPAVWDRLLRLPVPFFNDYTAGDLADRASGVDDIQRTVTANTLGLILGGVFSVFSLGLMFYYSVLLALGAVGLTLLYVAINVVASLRQLRFQRAMQEVEGRNHGFLLQMLNGLTKLRVSGKMQNAFGVWLKGIVRAKKLFMRAELTRIRLSAVSSAYSVLLVAILFAMVVAVGSDLSLGDFMAFNAAYGHFFASMLTMSGVIAGSVEIVPTYERSACILRSLPEVSEAGMPVRDLECDIRLEQVRFTYPAGSANRPDPQPAIDGIDIQVRAGEVVGLVGPSGCGKSTLFRLLLGFERPSQGRILFDGRDLVDLDLRSLRRCVGIVLQHGQLIPGTLLENILAGGASWAEDDAWAAARLACIDKDIEAMPMRMHTFVSEGGRNLSVGQRQRILIARALAKRPSVLLLDEATSAIDNRVQARLIENILTVGATCILSSHRLTTVRAASRLVVLDRGRVVQQGNYRELIAKKDPFAGLAGRPA